MFGTIWQKCAQFKDDLSEDTWLRPSTLSAARSFFVKSTVSAKSRGVVKWFLDRGYGLGKVRWFYGLLAVRERLVWFHEMFRWLRRDSTVKYPSLHNQKLEGILLILNLLWRMNLANINGNNLLGTLDFSFRWRYTLAIAFSSELWQDWPHEPLFSYASLCTCVVIRNCWNIARIFIKRVLTTHNHRNMCFLLTSRSFSTENTNKFSLPPRGRLS